MAARGFLQVLIMATAHDCTIRNESRATAWKFVALAYGVAVLFCLNLFFGSVGLTFGEVWDVVCGRADRLSTASYIVADCRLPMAVTAAAGGAALSLAGLLLQSAFRNPLAGPSVLGISSGASLGVALVMLALGGSISIGGVSSAGNAAVVAGAFAGSMAVTLLMVVLGQVVRNSLVILIMGMMVGYLTSSIIMLLNFKASSEGIHNYVMWGMSTFGNVSNEQLPTFVGLCIAGIVPALLMAKPLDLLLLGDDYARSSGVNMRAVNCLLLSTTGLLTATVTAFCGPVSFLGLAIPHVARLVFPTDSHRLLLPATLLTGAAVALGCNLLCVLPSRGVLPLNAATPLIGAPVIVWVLVRYRNYQ